MRGIIRVLSPERPAPVGRSGLSNGKGSGGVLEPVRGSFWNVTRVQLERSNFSIPMVSVAEPAVASYWYLTGRRDEARK